MADVSLVIVDETSYLIQTDRKHSLRLWRLVIRVIVSRKTGYRFVPEKQVVGEDREFVFTGLPLGRTRFH